MPFNEKLRQQILDELKSTPHKTKGFSDLDYEIDPDLLETLKEMERRGEIEIIDTSRRKPGKLPILIKLGVGGA